MILAVGAAGRFGPAVVSLLVRAESPDIPSQGCTS